MKNYQEMTSAQKRIAAKAAKESSFAIAKERIVLREYDANYEVTERYGYIVPDGSQYGTFLALIRASYSAARPRRKILYL